MEKMVTFLEKFQSLEEVWDDYQSSKQELNSRDSYRNPPGDQNFKEGTRNRSKSD
jgi:hypothetical protein